MNPRPQDHIRLQDGFVWIAAYYEIDDRQRVVTVRLVGLRNDDAVYWNFKQKQGR